MNPSETPNPDTAQQQAALACYLSALVAIAKCMEEVCPQAGLVFGNRLERLPRRLGFDATAKALESSRQSLEADLREYTEAARAWIDEGAELARQIRAAAEAMGSDTEQDDAELHTAMIEGLAEQMEASAELDEDSQLRPALRRYASGLRAYLQRRGVERRSAPAALRQHAAELGEWMAAHDPAERVDALTGLLNRQEGERQLANFRKHGKSFCVPVFQWDEAASPPYQLGRAGADQILKEFADRLVTLVRPRDIVCRWAPDQLAVIFDCPAPEARDRARKIAAWMSDKYSVVVEAKVRGVDARAICAVVEPVSGESLDELIRRIDSAFSLSRGQQVA